MRRALRWLVVALSPALVPLGAAAQDGPSEAARLRAAAEREARGELPAAERVLRSVLAERAESVPALLALERVLRIQGRLDELPPLLDAALERDPGSSLLHRMRLRTYGALDREEALETAGRSWIEAAPGREEPYRDVAAVWQARGEFGRARAVLEEGRRQIDRDNALALSLGELYARIGEPREAAREWARFLGDDGQGAAAVRRRLRDLPDPSAAAALVDRLTAGSPTDARLEVALTIATEAGLADRARSIAGARGSTHGSTAAVSGGLSVQAVEASPSAPSPPDRSSTDALAAADRARTLLAGGQPKAARAAYLEAVPGLRGGDATEALSMVALLDRISGPAARLLGEAVALEDTDPAAAIDRVATGTAALALEDRPPLLDWAAAVADAAGLTEAAAALRRRIVDEYAASAEAPAALLWLAETALDTDPDRARERLERLILEYPSSALVPRARRALERLEPRGER